MTQREIWKDIMEYENLYQISNFGNIKSKDRTHKTFNYKKNEKINRKIVGKELKKYITNKGYLQVVLCKNGKTKRYSIHRLVAQTFIPNPESKPQVNHIDGNKLNNNASNLEFCTASENAKHAFENKLINFNTEKKRKSELINIKKAQEKNKKRIDQYDLKDNFIKRWNSIMDVERNMKINHSNITMVALGIRKTAGGYKWKYVLEGIK